MATEERQKKNADNRAIHELMEGPLVSWVRTFHEDTNGRETKLTYSHLTDGIFLYNVLTRIDPRSVTRSLTEPADDAYTRIRNFDTLVKAIKGFYEEVLGQLVLVRLPDPVVLGREPPSEISLAQMQTLLLLFLGCAVQGPKKEDAIEGIKKLPLETQHAIVECIQQVADNPNCVWNKDWNDWESIDFHTTGILPLEGVDHSDLMRRSEIFKILVHHLKRLVQERDDYAQQLTTLIISDMAPNSSSYSSAMSWSIGSTSSDRQNNGNSQNSSILVELAESKGKLRRCRQELEEKCEQVAELREELEAARTISIKVKQENMDLVQEARLSKALRDELDIVREKASKVDRLEAELNRYKDKLNDIDYYKARLEELREDNRLLEETKTILESQLETARQRAELVLDLESELLNYKTQITNLLVEKESDRERLKKLAEENAHLQLCTKNCLSESASLTAEIESLRAHQAICENKDAFANLSEQMISKDLVLRVRRLEQENQRLSAQLSSQNSKAASRGDTADRILQLEGENTKLRLRATDLEEERKVQDQQVAAMIDSLKSRANEVDRQNEELRRAHEEHLNVIETLKAERGKLEELESQTVSLNSENQKLQRNIDTFERRLESIQSEARDFESENVKLHKTVDSLRHSLRRLNDLERENTELEAENHRLDRENKGHVKEISRLKQSIEMKESSIDQYSSKLVALERECKRLQTETETLHGQAAKLREFERENKELQQAAVVEHKTLNAIREELVQEKIRLQQLQCQFDAKTRTLDDTLIEFRNVKNSFDQIKETCVCAAAHPEKAVSADAVQNKQEQTADMLPPTIELGREVLAIKDRLVELERQNAVLLAEKDNFTGQMQSQKERLHESNSQLSALSQQLATLQVENSTLSSQLNSMTTQNGTLASSLESANAERDDLIAQLNGYQERLERLSKDQEELQKLHEQLQSDYEALLDERESLKAVQRECKAELKAAQDRLAECAEAEKSWNVTKSELEGELEKSKGENRALSNLRAEHSRLKDDFRSLFVTNEKLKTEYKNIQSDYKGLRVDHNALKLKHTQLQGEAAECRHEVTNLDVELGKLNSKWEALQQMNNSLLEDKRNMINQVSLLLTQYHELLNQTLEEKGHYLEESKLFSDKLNHLKRQKELLEDCIIEENRKLESNLTRAFESENNLQAPQSARANYGAILARQLRKATSDLVSRPDASRSRSNSETLGMKDVADNFAGEFLNQDVESQGQPVELNPEHQTATNDAAASKSKSGSPALSNRLVDANNRHSSESLFASAKTSETHLKEPNNPAEGASDGENGVTLPTPPRYEGSLIGNGANVLASVSSPNIANSATMPFYADKFAPWSRDASPRLNSTPVGGRTFSRYDPKTPTSGLTSAASSMLMSPSAASSPLPKVQPPPRIPRSTLHLANQSTQAGLDAPSALAKNMQPSRSLALLERAGSRQPVCLADADPEIVLPAENLTPSTSVPGLILPRNLDSPLRSSSPGDLGGDGNMRLRSDLVQMSAPSTAESSCNPSPRNTNQVMPNVTSTTRISVSISSPSVGHQGIRSNSPQASGSEPRSSPKLLSSPHRMTATEQSDAPLLPLRISRTDKPALPPRPHSTSTAVAPDGSSVRSETVNQRATPVEEGISSVWYEYGCV